MLHLIKAHPHNVSAAESHLAPPEPITVWLVEDDAFFRETVEKLLAGADGVARPHSFGSCEEALAALESQPPPEVVLMDVGLPGMSGIDGIRQVQARSPASHIVMLTVHEDHDKIFEALCAGASGYLLKPSSGPQIVAAVRAARQGGAPITPQIARKVLDLFTGLAVPRGDYGLTAREHEVLECLVGGRTKQQIADDLFVSFHTVDMHVRNIYAKLHVHSRSGAVAKALKERLI